MKVSDNSGTTSPFNIKQNSLEWRLNIAWKDGAMALKYFKMLWEFCLFLLVVETAAQIRAAINVIVANAIKAMCVLLMHAAVIFQRLYGL